MKSVISSMEERMQKSITALENEYNTLRSGRASTALFDKIKVDYYGQETPLSQVASISVPEARLVVIQPWDKSLLGEIEKAIQKSELSVNPNNDGKVIRINIPPLTEERRKEFGTRRALGETRDHLALQTCIEMGFAALTGLVAGLVLANMLRIIINSIGGIPMAAAPGMATSLRVSIIQCPEAIRKAVLITTAVPPAALVLPLYRALKTSIVDLISCP